MSENVKELTADNFDSFVKKGETVIDFWAEWCGPCKYLSPIVEKIASENKKIKFGKVDVDSQTDLAQRFQVMSIPTLLFFKDGEMVNRTSGAMPKEDLEEEIGNVF